MRALLALRAAHPAFRADAVRMQAEGLPDDVAVYVRGAGRDFVAVAANFGRRKRPATILLPAAEAWQNVLESRDASPGPGGEIALTLEPGAVAVFASVPASGAPR